MQLKLQGGTVTCECGMEHQLEATGLRMHLALDHSLPPQRVEAALVALRRGYVTARTVVV